MKPTECDDLLQVTERQSSAIDLLLSGQSDSAVANTLGLHRTSIARWRAHHPGFKAELTRRRAESFGSEVERLRSLVGKAIDVLENSLNDGKHSLTAAQAILKLSGMAQLAPPQIAPDDAETILAKLVDVQMADDTAVRQLSMPPEEIMMETLMPDPEEREEHLAKAKRQVREELRQKLMEEPQNAETNGQRRTG
jgi:hypothetical protein